MITNIVPNRGKTGMPVAAVGRIQGHANHPVHKKPTIEAIDRRQKVGFDSIKSLEAYIK